MAYHSSLYCFKYSIALFSIPLRSLDQPIRLLHRTHKSPLISPVLWLWSMLKYFVLTLPGLSLPQIAQQPFCSFNFSSYHSMVTPYVFFKMLFLCILALISGLSSLYFLSLAAAFFLFSGFCLHFLMYSFLCGVCACSLSLGLFFSRHFWIMALYFAECFFLYSANLILPHCLQLYLWPSGALCCLWNSVNGNNLWHLLHSLSCILNPIAFDFYCINVLTNNRANVNV